MARFLSPEWFAELPPLPAGGEAELVLEVLVADGPEGEVRYQVVVGGGHAWVLPPGSAFRAAHVRLSSDYATVAAIARGVLAPADAMAQGLARVGGDISALSALGQVGPGEGLLPAPVRAATTF
jgi:hypothetical protein